MTLRVLALSALLLIQGCGSSREMVPLDAEAASAFLEQGVAIQEVTLGSGDRLQISVWRNPELDGTYELDPGGRVHLPLVGQVEAGGLTPYEIRDRVVEALGEYLVDPQVQVNVTAYRERKVFVLGEVQKPGIFNMGNDVSTLIEAIAAGGGFTSRASRASVVLIRGGLNSPELRLLDVEALLTKGALSQNPYLRAGDIVYVPSSTIAKVEAFFEVFSTIIRPIYDLERAIILEPQVEEVLKGGDGNIGIIIR